MTLKDTKTVVQKIERIIYAFLHIIFIFFYLLIFNVSSCFMPIASGSLSDLKPVKHYDRFHACHGSQLCLNIACCCILHPSWSKAMPVSCSKPTNATMQHIKNIAPLLDILATDQQPQMDALLHWTLRIREVYPTRRLPGSKTNYSGCCCANYAVLWHFISKIHCDAGRRTWKTTANLAHTAAGRPVQPTDSESPPADVVRSLATYASRQQ